MNVQDKIKKNGKTKKGRITIWFFLENGWMNIYQNTKA